MAPDFLGFPLYSPPDALIRDQKRDVEHKRWFITPLNVIKYMESFTFSLLCLQIVCFILNYNFCVLI